MMTIVKGGAAHVVSSEGGMGRVDRDVRLDAVTVGMSFFTPTERQKKNSET